MESFTCTCGKELNTCTSLTHHCRPSAASAGYDSTPAILKMQEAYLELKKQGWRDSIYAPKDNSEILVIEVGSTGIHKATRDEDGYFWTGEDGWPIHPCLWKAKES